MKREKIVHYQNNVLKALSNQIDDFYLGGGTALSLFYFQHRLSVDLDFFTPHFSDKRIREIVTYLRNDLNKQIRLGAQNLKEDKTRMMVYHIHFTANTILKIDFVEDVLNLIKKPKNVEGVRILSLEDIYLRKIYAVAGTISTIDEVGRKRFLGGRAEAKDFYDLYFLSHTFNPLSRFVNKYGDAVVKEGLIAWFRSYDRMRMMDSFLELDTDKKADYRNMERHFNTEINKILEGEVRGI